MRHLLTQAANAAVKAKGSVIEALYRCLAAPVAHRICRIAWKILHDGVRYQERVLRTPEAVRQRTTKLVGDLHRLGYRVQLTPITSESVG